MVLAALVIVVLLIRAAGGTARLAGHGASATWRVTCRGVPAAPDVPAAPRAVPDACLFERGSLASATRDSIKLAVRAFRPRVLVGEHA